MNTSPTKITIHENMDLDRYNAETEAYFKQKNARASDLTDAQDPEQSTVDAHGKASRSTTPSQTTPNGKAVH